jgi:hypothetical protein
LSRGIWFLTYKEFSEVLNSPGLVVFANYEGVIEARLTMLINSSGDGIK